MKLIEKLKKLAKNKTFIAWFILVVIGIVIIIYNNPILISKKVPFETPETQFLATSYKVTKINPIELDYPMGFLIYGDKVMYYDRDDTLYSYDIKNKKTSIIEKDYSRIFDLGEKYAVYVKREGENSDTNFIYLYDIKSGVKTKIAETHNYPRPIIFGNYIYWNGDNQEQSLVKYDILNKKTEYFNVPFIILGANSSNVVYLQGVENENSWIYGELNRLVMYNTLSGEKTNLSEDKSIKSYISVSDSYIVWGSKELDGNTKIKYYSINSGETKEALIPEKKGISGLDIDKNILVYFSGGCLYSYDIDINKEKIILCDNFYTEEGISLNDDKVVVEKRLSEDTDPNKNGDLLLIEL